MKVSLNWIKEYVDIDDISEEEIIERLTMSGLEVEDFINQKEIYKDFIVALVTSKEKHPNADKLSLCRVNTGKEELQVVCGAPNVAEGQKVVFAPVGSVIPSNSLKIEKVKIRGIESDGMICSGAELELDDDHSGILVLDGKYKPGTRITKALKLDDVILEIGITPNRPDALSHIGIARDLAAVFNRRLKLPEVRIKESKEKAADYASVEIIDTENCPRYTSRIVKNVTIKESPRWLKDRLTKIGLRPINNIVDITNYVMYECGQPLHAFDLDMLAGKKIIVKSTERESNFTTLDSKVRKLPAGTLMICDGDREVAVAGVMGGENSEVTDRTRNILIESAHFNPSHIRKVARYLGLTTDASYRFERTVDPSNTDFAADRAAALMAELAGGEVLKGLIDIYPSRIKRRKVKFRLSRMEKLLGYKIGRKKVSGILNRLGIDILQEKNDEFKLSIPTYRPDLEREVDIIEEVSRIYGYDLIPPVSRINITLEKKYDESAFTDKLREICTGLGLYEILNNPLLDEKSAFLYGNPIKLLNPQSQDMAYLRTSLIPGALSVITKNINRGEKNQFFFEIGHVFNKTSENSIKSFGDFAEERKILFILTGFEQTKEWNLNEKWVDFYSLKGLVDNFILKFSLDNVLNDSYYHSENTFFDYYFTKSTPDSSIGSGGRIKKDVLKQFDINQDVFCFEFNLDRLSQLRNTFKSYVEPVKYPKVIRDFSFIFNKSVTYRDIFKFVKEKGSILLKEIKLFDLFESESLGKDKKSMAFTLSFQADDRTLTEEEAEKEFLNLIKLIEEKFNAKLRGI